MYMFIMLIIMVSSALMFYKTLNNWLKTIPYCEKNIVPVIENTMEAIINILTYFCNLLYKKMVVFLRDYLIEVIQDKELNDKLNKVLKTQLDRLLLDQELNKQLIETIKADFSDLLDDAEMNAYIHELIQKQLESTDTSQRTRAALAKIFKTHIETMTKEEWFISEIVGQITMVATNTCESVEVKDKLRELLEKLSGDLIDSGEVNKKLNALSSQIINDEEFIKTLGSGVRKAVRSTWNGLWWTESRPEYTKEGTKETTKETITDEPRLEIKQEELARPTVEKLKISVVPKVRSNSMSDSFAKEQSIKSQDS